MRILIGMLAFLAMLSSLRSHASPSVVAIAGILPHTNQQELREVFLRGYGRVSGRHSVFRSGSILELDCENADRAKLTQAKYLSDLQLLPGVQRVRMKNNTDAWKIDGQGAIAALRLENKVLILASSSLDGLDQLARDGLRGNRNLRASAEVPVPMWMDHWDKYGFRLCDYDNVRMYRPQNSDPRTFDAFESLQWLHDKAKMGLAVDPYASQQFSGTRQRPPVG